MSKGGSYGGGQSSLGYLFGADKQPTPPAPVSTPAIHVTKPPWGDDNSTEKPPQIYAPSTVSSYYLRSQGQNKGNFITDRPSTRVQSVPGGDSSLGYLFGDK